jgi:hypothetical protein
VKQGLWVQFFVIEGYCFVSELLSWVAGCQNEVRLVVEVLFDSNISIENGELGCSVESALGFLPAW